MHEPQSRPPNETTNLINERRCNCLQHFRHKLLTACTRHLPMEVPECEARDGNDNISRICTKHFIIRVQRNDYSYI